MFVYAIFACSFLHSPLQRCALINPGETYRSLHECQSDVRIVYGGAPGEFVCRRETAREALTICHRYTSLKWPPLEIQTPAK